MPRLQGDPDVAEFSGGGGSTVLIGREPINILGLDQVKGAIEPVILEGRAPRAVDEIALGTRALRAIHAGVGDVVDIVANADRKYRIVGRTAVPPAITRTVA